MKQNLRQRNLRLFLVFNALMIGALLAPLSSAFAQGKASTEKSIAASGFGKGRDVVVRKHLENTDKQEPQLSWPPFPRVWMERSSTHIENSSTNIGFSLSIGSGPSGAGFGLPGLSAAHKHSYDYKFSVTTSLILISSTETQAIDPITARPHSDYNHLQGDELFLTLKPGTSLVYPLVTSKKPMVGLCFYEMNLVEDETKTKGLEFLGSSKSNTTGTSELGKVSRFSNFFQINGDVAVESYHYDVCQKIFKKQVESSVLKTFSLLVYQMENNTCSPPPANDIDPQGDLSCMQWHDQFHKTTKHQTVPRCEQNLDGNYRCVLRAKPGIQCRLYQNRKTGERSDKFDFKNFYTAVSDFTVGVGCDKALKQTCQMQKEPLFTVMGIPFIKGTAHCVK